MSACHDSVVCVWSLETGEKIIQFSNAHGISEITAMRFDPSKRRLITGARDGTVRIWNFNNGCCLSELQAVDNEEVIQAALLRLLAAGSQNRSFISFLIRNSCVASQRAGFS